MFLIRRKPMSRRRLLQGLGVGIGLPFLEVMMPTESYAETIHRTGFVYNPMGWYRLSQDFFPQEQGINYTMPRLLTALEPYRQNFNILSSLSNAGGRSGNDGPGDHARAAGTYMSSVRILKDVNKVLGGQTIDRYIVSKIHKNTTPIDMLLMGIGSNDGGDSGYNNLNQRISWRDQNNPVHWDNASTIYQRLVSLDNRQNQGVIDTQAQIRNQLRKSALDYVLQDELPRLQQALGTNDRQKLDQYLTGLREIEQRISTTTQTQTATCNQIAAIHSGGSLRDEVNVLFDLMITAFECDLTRVIVIGFNREASNRTVDGTSGGWHNNSHYRDSNSRKAEYDKIGFWVADRAADLMSKLQTSGLMSSSLISFGAGTGGNESEAHGDDNLPTLLIGQGGGASRTGRHLRLPNPTPIANLWATMAHHAGTPVPNDRWGSFGTGKINLT